MRPWYSPPQTKTGPLYEASYLPTSPQAFIKNLNDIFDEIYEKPPEQFWAGTQGPKHFKRWNHLIAQLRKKQRGLARSAVSDKAQLVLSNGIGRYCDAFETCLDTWDETYYEDVFTPLHRALEYMIATFAKVQDLRDTAVDGPLESHGEIIRVAIFHAKHTKDALDLGALGARAIPKNKSLLSQYIFQRRIALGAGGDR